MIVTSHPAVLNGFINQTRRYMEQEKELAAQQVTIDDQLCLKIDEWKSGEDTYVLGNSLQDNEFFYVLVNGNVHFEYDYKPDREEVETDYLNVTAMEDIDRHEAEVFSRIEGTEDYLQGKEQEPVTSGHDVQRYRIRKTIKKALLIEFNNTFNPYPERIPLYLQSGSRESDKACLR